MKRLKGLYFILTYVMFILPPFIWGLVELYADRPRLDIHVISLIVNIIVLLLLAGICYALIRSKKLHVPSSLEWKYLILGLTGNTVVYFYTFQNNMNIDRYITIYLILLIVLLVHYFLISRKIVDWELWLLLPLFLVLDALHLMLYGCPVTNSYLCIPNNIASGWLYLVYVPIILSIFGYYGYKIVLYKRRGFYGISNIVLVIILSVLFQINDNMDERIIGTLVISLAFLGILHFIVNIVNKTYDHTILFHYIRTTTLLFFATLLGEIGFFKGNVETGILVFMVAATYVSLAIVILKYLLHVEEDSISLQRTCSIVEITPHVRKQIETEYGTAAFDHISMARRSLSLAAILNDDVIGFISTVVKPLPIPLDNSEEAYINRLEVHKQQRRKRIATKLVRHTEQQFRKEGLHQIRGWVTSDNLEAVHLWNHLHYTVSPIYDTDPDTSIKGFYFSKKL